VQNPTFQGLGQPQKRKPMRYYFCYNSHITVHVTCLSADDERISSIAMSTISNLNDRYSHRHYFKRTNITTFICHEDEIYH
jgi:hypothetical protein